MTGEGSWREVLAGEAMWTVVQADNADMLPLLPDLSIDVTITDPPYSEAVHSRSIRRTYLPDVAAQPCRRTRAYDFGFDHLTPAEQEFCAREWARVTKRWVAVFSDLESQDSWKHALEEYGLEHIRQLVWVKDRAMPQISGDRPGSWAESIELVHRKGKKRWNGGGLGNVYRHPVVVNCNGHRSDRIHTAQKPETLMMQLVEHFSDPGEVVLDDHAGSSTTGVACLRLGRRFIGVEKDRAYAELSRERLRAEEQSSTLHARSAGQVAMFQGGERPWPRD